MNARFPSRLFAAGLCTALLATPALAQPSSKADAVDAMALYNRGAAVIQTTREIDLDAGKQTVGWPVEGRLRADTLWLEGDGVRLLGLSALSNDDSGAGRLAARIGQPVTLLRDDANGTQARDATLIGLSGGTALVRVDDRIERLSANSPWRLAWPAGDDAPSGLQLDLDADTAGTQPLTATYQIDGPSWQASYTGRFDAEAGELALQSLAVIDNSSGSALNADKAWLVAGDIARAGGRGPQPMMMARSEAKMADSAPEPVGDSYRYTLDSPLKVAAGATRAVALMTPVTLDAERHYRFESSFYAQPRDGQRRHAAVELHFDNTAGKPLPAGVVRVYDGNRSATLMGEDSIGDTPEGAPVTLALGSAFDITGERRRVKDSKNDNDQRQRTVEITLHNASERRATVEVVERLPEAAEIVSSSQPAADDSAANIATWQVDVPAQDKTTLRYSAKWPAQ